MADTDWCVKYKNKVVSASDAIKKIRRGARIFLGTGCGIPLHLVQELVKNANRLSDNEIMIIAHIRAAHKTCFSSSKLKRGDADNTRPVAHRCQV